MPAPFVQSPTLLLVLDKLARRYGVDPWTVLEWDPDRLALALACMEQAVVSMEQFKRQNKNAFVVPVIDAGML